MAEDEGGERHESEAERDLSDEENDADVPLDKDSVKAEPDEQFSSDAKSEEDLQSDAEKVSDMSNVEEEGHERSDEQSYSQSEDELDLKQQPN